MHLPSTLASHIRTLHTGGNWTDVNLKDLTADITWQEATTEISGLNTIAKLVFHINYFIKVQAQVLEGQPLDAHDKYSFDVPEINSEADWKNLLNISFEQAEKLANLVETMPDSQLWEPFAGINKYGTYYRNIQGMLEHSHYHLGQISLIKKLLMPQ